MTIGDAAGSALRASRPFPPRKILSLFLGCLTLIATLPVTGFGHGGGLDASGCHHDRKRGGYHCHGSSGASRPSSARSSRGRGASGPASGSFTGKVVGVTDGDTVKVLLEGREVRVRLDGIDCPEKRQAFGSRARQATSGMVFGREVTVQVSGRDRYGRTLGEVLLQGGVSVNRTLLREGLAWWYWKYSSDTSLGALERDAREARRGLWADANPVAPWAFRRARR